jgi:hypothetical protein
MSKRLLLRVDSSVGEERLWEWGGWSLYTSGGGEGRLGSGH